MYKQAVIDLGPWSLSKAQTAVNCPYKFRKQYIEKAKGSAEPKSSAGLIGTAVHKVLERALKNKTVTDAFAEALVGDELTTVEKEDVKSFAHNVRAFCERMDKFKQQQKVTKTYVEHKFGLSTDLEPVGFFDNSRVFFRGVWDLGMVTASKYVVIIDHKTGAPQPIQKYQDQMWAYALSALSTEPDLRGVQPAIHFVGTEEIAWNKMINRGQIEADLIPWLGTFLEKAVASAERGTPKKSWLCNFCQYIDICPLVSSQKNAAQKDSPESGA